MSMKWQDLVLQLKVFCNRSSFRYRYGSYAAESLVVLHLANWTKLNIE